MSYTVKVKKLKENAVVPKRATIGSAGADLYACIDEPAMHRMVVNYLANNRQGTQSALTRSGVQATKDRVRLVLHSGHTAVLFSHQSQEATDSRLIRR